MNFSRFPLGRAALVGAGTYVVTYGLAFVLVSGRMDSLLSETTVATSNGSASVASLLSNTALPTWKGVGWVLYGALRIPIQIPGDVNLLPVAVSTGASILLFAVTVASFVGGGYWTYRSISSRAGQWKYAGVGIALGYVLCVVAGALLFTVRVRGITAGPDILLSLIAGLVIPVISGAVGGRLAA